TNMAAALTEACDLAKADLAEDDQPDLIPWDGWTDAIARILEKAQLPRGVSKSEYSTSQPFVNLIAKLQELVPRKYRKHGETRDSLVQALFRARGRMDEARERR